MVTGKWFLCYEYDSHERGLGNTSEQVKIPLLATTQEDVIAEARKKWRDLLVEAKGRWEEQQTKAAHPPANPFEDGPRNPSLICELDIIFQRPGEESGKE